jgi:hypothetical protein
MIFHGLVRSSDQTQHNVSMLAWSGKRINPSNVHPYHALNVRAEKSADTTARDLEAVEPSIRI